MRGGKTIYRPEFCQEAIDFMGKGYSIAALAAHLGVCRDTIYKWIENYDEFGDAIAKGRVAGQKFFENALMAKITGEDLTGTINLKSSDTTALIFALKTRFHKTYGEKQEVTHNVKPAFEIVPFEDEDDV